MGIVIRQGLKSTIVAYLGILIGAFNLLWLFPKFLTKEEIGLTRVVIDIAMIIAALSQMGVTNISDRFFSFYKDEGKKHQGFLLLLLVYPLIGFIIICAIYLALEKFWIRAYEDHSALLLDYLIEIIPLAFFIMYLNILEAYSRVHYRIVVPNMVREVFLRVFFALVVVLYHFKYITLDGLIYLIIASYFFAVILLFSYIKKLGKLFLTSGTVFQNRMLLKSMIVYGLFIFLGGASGLIAAKIDIIMLSSMKDLGMAGVYTIAFFIGTVIEIPRRMISQITIPFISEAWKNKDFITLKNIYHKTSINQFIVGTFLFLVIWLNIDHLFSLIPKSENFIEGKYVVLLIGLGRLTDMLTGVNTEIILNSPYYKFNFYVIIVNSILLIGLNYMLIPPMGLNGAALSILISFVTFNIVKFLFLYVKFKIQPFTIQTFWILILGIVAFLAVNFIPDMDAGTVTALFNIIIRSFFVLILFIGPILYFKLSEDLEAMLKGLVSRYKK